MDLTQEFVRNLTDMRSEEQREVLRGLINRLDTSNRIDLIGLLVEEGTVVLDRILDLASRPLMGEQNTFSELENRFNALRESEAEILANLDTSLNSSGARLNESIEVEQPDPTTADMPEGSSDINVDPPSQNLLDESVEVGPLGTTTDYQSPDVDPRTGERETINSGQGQQGNSPNPASGPDLAELAEGMNMNWGDIVERERDTFPYAEWVREQEQLIQGEARKKKTKKKRRKSKKKKKPYEDLIMTQKKRLAKLQKMSEKLSKKMSKTKKKRRKKKVSDSY